MLIAGFLCRHHHAPLNIHFFNSSSPGFFALKYWHTRCASLGPVSVYHSRHALRNDDYSGKPTPDVQTWVFETHMRLQSDKPLD